MAGSRAVRRLLRLLPFLIRSNIRRGLWAMRRAPSTLKPYMPKLLKISALTLTLILASLLTSSDAHWTFTTKPPAPLGEWILPTLVHHYLGRPIEATLRFTGPMGVYVDPSSLPCEGETVGPFEVRKRTSRIYNTGGIQITEFRYSLQYLFPLNRGVFTGQDLREMKFEYHYRYYYKWYRFTSWLKGKEITWPAKVYLLRRTRPGDRPFLTVGKVAEPFALNNVLKVVGGLVLGGVLLFHVGRLANAARMRRKRRQSELAEAARPRRELLELWGQWQEAKEYRLFLAACVIARDLEKRQLGLSPGGLLPRLKFWLVTTIALYSGEKLSFSRVKETFKLFLRRFPVREAMIFLPS